MSLLNFFSDNAKPLMDQFTIISSISTQLSKIFIVKQTPTNETLVLKLDNENTNEQNEIAILNQIKSLKIPHCILIKDIIPLTPEISSKLNIESTNSSLFIFPQYFKFGVKDEWDLYDIARITRQVLTALKGLHSNKIAHLDINTSNLMMDKDRNMVLIDFGLSRRFSGDVEDVHPLGVGTSVI